MGIVVGEPFLKRNRKRPKDPKASYYIYWTDSIEGSKEKSTRKTKYAEAIQFYNRWRLKYIGITESRPISEILIDEVLEYYTDAQIARNKSTERLNSSIKRLSPFWGKRPASTVNMQTVKDYETYRFDLHDELFPDAETISINTIRRELVDLRSALNRAFKDRVTDRTVNVELPAEIQKGVESFTLEEVKTLLFAAQCVKRAKHHLPLFIKIGLLTGRRKTAILQLKWSQIDFDLDRIYWSRNERTKSKKRSPDARLPPRLKRMLLRYRKLFPNDEYVISYQGRPISDIKTSFAQAVEGARKRLAKAHDVKPEDVLKVAYPHMFRHTAATLQMRLGADPRQLCGFLGMTFDTLERRYWHHHPDSQHGPANTFGSR